MSTISRIRSNIESLEVLIRNIDENLQRSPEDFSLALQKNSLTNQIDDLRHQLYSENLKREKEIVKIRLIGAKARYGTLPLQFVSGITGNFSEAIFNTSKYLKFGKKGGKKKENIIRETIDLRLEDIGSGSTIFYISGKTSPDLMGNSILQNTLENTFNFFNSISPDDISDSIPNVGNKSLKYISKFLNELTSDELDCDIHWQSPDEREFFWEGRKENILSLYNTINQIEISEPEEFQFEGELVTISAKGKFEISTIENETISGSFSNDLLSVMEEFHIKDYCSGKITKTKIYNPITDKEKTEYNLIEINTVPNND